MPIQNLPQVHFWSSFPGPLSCSSSICIWPTTDILAPHFRGFNSFWTTSDVTSEKCFPQQTFKVGGRGPVALRDLSLLSKQSRHAGAALLTFNPLSPFNFQIFGLTSSVISHIRLSCSHVSFRNADTELCSFPQRVWKAQS